MKRKENILLVLSSGGMILSCVYACSAFILACLAHKPIPLPAAAGVLFLATLLTYRYHQKGWRRITILGLHMAGFFFSALWLCHSYYSIQSSFWDHGWVLKFLKLEREVAGWFAFILVLLCVQVLWFFGRKLGTQPADRTTINHRFDGGLAFFLALLVLKLAIAVKESSVPMAHSSTRSIIVFVLLGLFSMGLVRTRRSSQTGGISYLKGAGIFMSFTVIILMFGGGLFILFLPELRTLAGTGADLIKTVTVPLGPVVVALLRFFLVAGCRGKFREEPISGEVLPSTPEETVDLGVLELLSAYLMMGLIIVIALVAVGLIQLYLIRWLRVKTDIKQKKKGIWERLLSLFDAVKRSLFFLKAKFFVRNDGFGAAKKIYRRLLQWGRVSGLSYAVSETPREYGLRLGNRFPNIEEEIRQIIHVHDDAIYGCIPPDRPQISRARQALRKMRHPCLWFARMKSLCFHDRF